MKPLALLLSFSPVRLRPLFPYAAASVLCAFAVSGCAGGAADRDFRSKVKSATVSTDAEYDPMTRTTRGNLTTTIEFRDPSKDR